MNKKLSKKRIEAFQEEILEWYGENKRDLPWRRPTLKLRNGKARDPYGILVSEVMAQQTQLSRVVPKYTEWMKTFPTLESLANASIREVLALWSGLGYNRRALFLQNTAKKLVSSSFIVRSKKNSSRLRSNNNHNDPLREKISWPETEKELRKLPGIGEYTARALLCFAFNKQVAVVDTNVRKVILTKFFSERAKRVEEPSTSSGKKSIISAQAGLQENKEWIPGPDFAKGFDWARQARDDDKRITTNKEIQEIADQLLPEGKAYEWNQALMDYSSAVLKDKKIPIPKQSHFKTSNRFYRGQVIRLLLKSNKQTLTMLFRTIENNGISKKEFEKTLMQLVKDQLVLKKDQYYTLP